MIEIITSEDGFEALANEWCGFETNPNLAVTQTFRWVHEGWKILREDASSKLWILRWSQDGNPDVVIFPFYIDGAGVLRWIFDTESDVCGAIHSAAAVNRHWAYREAADEILKESAIKSIELHKMRGGEESLDYLSVFIKRAHIFNENASAYIEVESAGDFIVGQKHLKSDGRKHLKKLLRQGSEYEFVIHSKTNGDAFPEEAIKSLRDSMIAAGSRSSAYFGEKMVSFVRTMYEFGSCEIPMLKKDGEPITIEFRMLKGNTSLDWIYLSKDSRTGTLINVRYCVETTKDRSGVIDFGTGAYEYKILTTRPKLKAVYTLVAHKTLRSEFRYVYNECKRLVKGLIASKILKRY